jgi:hypothetical protein
VIHHHALGLTLLGQQFRSRTLVLKEA